MEKKRFRKKLFFFIGFIVFLYLFIFSITLIKFSSSLLGNEIFTLTKNKLSPVNSFGFGWLLTLITQSSGASATTLIAFSLSGIIGPVVLIYMIIGTRVGTSITALFTSFLVHAKKRDFRHGFEIGLANLVYAFPIAIIMLLIESFTGFFHKSEKYFISIGSPFSINPINYILNPVLNIFSNFPKEINLILGIFILIISLKYMPKFMIGLFGENYIKIKINKFLDKKWKSFFLGFLITSFLMSTSITITFLIPLVVTRITKLKNVIPYMIGANLGGLSEMILGGLILGRGAFPAIFAYVSFSLIGLLWMLNTNLLFKITKFLSKRTIHVSRKRSLIFIILFILIAIILTFI